MYIASDKAMPQQIVAWTGQDANLKHWYVIRTSDDDKTQGAQLDAERIANALNAIDKISIARDKLRATQKNWDEDCLFECDRILTEIIAQLDK